MSTESAKLMPFKISRTRHSELSVLAAYLGIGESTLLRLCRNFGTEKIFQLVAPAPVAPSFPSPQQPPATP